MAYAKNTWLPRIGQGLNKFLDSISGKTLELTNTPDSVSQEGTPFSAAWMNNIEDGIAALHEIPFSALPASGTALTAQGAYTVPASSPVTSYVFAAPAQGWAHGTFFTGSSVSISFASGAQFLSDPPSLDPSTQYEFDVLNGVWIVAEVVS